MTTPIPGKRKFRLTLGGVERDYQLDLAAMTYAEEAYGEPLPMQMAVVLTSFRGLRAVLYGGLKRCDPSLTLAQFDDLAALDDLIGLKDQIIGAVNDAQPKEGDVPLADEAVAVAPAS